MARSYMKPRKRKQRLETRIKDWEKTMGSNKSLPSGSFTKPGSLNK